jgi:hypothetical protein
VILDTGFLVSVDRGERAAQEFLAAALRHNTQLHSTEPVVAQVWRDGSRQARLARLLGAIAVHPLDDGRTVGAILAHSGTADVVDAHLVSVAIRIGEPILTADVGDIGRIVAALPDHQPGVHRWP